MSRPAGSTSGTVAALIVVWVVVALTHLTAAHAVIVAPITMGTLEDFSVLGATTVTNANLTVLDGNLGLSPGTSITGFPPGVVLPPSTVENSTAVAVQAQADLTAAYLEAEGRPIDATTPPDLGGLILPGGVYAASGKGPLGVTGSLVLDGAGDPSSVFIFQTDTTLTTASGSTVSLINGAQECNVFWQVGSSATLGTNSLFTGSVMALASVTVNSGVLVHGRTLARTGAVTLDRNTFVAPTCATAPTTTTTTLAPTTTTLAPTTTTTLPPLPPTTTTLAPTTTTTLPPLPPTTTTLAPTTTTTVPPLPPTTTTLAPTTTTILPPLPPTTTTTTTASAATTTTTRQNLAVTTTSEDHTAPTQPSDSDTTATTQASEVLGAQVTATTGPTTSATSAQDVHELPRTGGPRAPALVLAIMGGLLIAARGAARLTPRR